MKIGVEKALLAALHASAEFTPTDGVPNTVGVTEAMLEAIRAGGCDVVIVDRSYAGDELIERVTKPPGST